MFSRRCSFRVDFGFQSMALTSSSPTRAKTMGTRCGVPSGLIVESMARWALEKRPISSSIFTLAAFSGDADGIGYADALCAPFWRRMFSS